MTPSRVSSTPPPSEVPLGGFPSHGSHTIPLLHDRFLEMSPNFVVGYQKEIDERNVLPFERTWGIG